jgi:hypothetical protein
MAKAFKVGDHVGMGVGIDDDDEGADKLRYSEETELLFGTITDVLSTGKVLVKWEDGNDYYKDPLDTKNIMFAAALKAKYSELEKQYKELEKELSAKMKEAAKLIKEAGKIARKQGYELANMDAGYELYGAMDACGWRTSSFGC